MNSLELYIIDSHARVIDALEKLNRQQQTMTLFVVNDNHRIIGTITDGDIRRRLIAGTGLGDSVSAVMNTQYKSLRNADIDVAEIRKFKALGIALVPVLDEKGHIIDILNLRRQQSYLPVDAVLMAGGKGERLRPMTLTTPKPLLKIGNKSIIDYNIDRLIDFGIKNISVTVNYLKEQIEAHFAEPRGGVKINTVEEPNFLGTIGSIKFVPEFHNDVVLLMNSDLFTNINFEDMYLHFIEHGADMSAAAVPYDISVPLGIFDLDGRNIRGIIEKPTYNFYANAGIYMFKRELIDCIPDNTFYNATDLIARLAAEGSRVIRFPIAGYWLDIGKPEEYARAQVLAKHVR